MKRRGQMQRYAACYKCHRPLLSGGWAWIVEIPCSRITLNAEVQRMTEPRLFCDECGRAA